MAGRDAVASGGDMTWEVFRNLVAWEGVVEGYGIRGHPKAKRCYAWTIQDDGQLKTTAVLEIPPVDSPQTAVKIAIAAAAKKVQI